jgi:hypothetical protein
VRLSRCEDRAGGLHSHPPKRQRGSPVAARQVARHRYPSGVVARAAGASESRRGMPHTGSRTNACSALKRPSSGQRTRPATSRSRSSWADNHDRRSFVFGKLAQQAHRLRALVGVAVGGRLIGQDQGRAVGIARAISRPGASHRRRASRPRSRARPAGPSTRAGRAPSAAPRPFSPGMFGSERARGASPRPPSAVAAPGACGRAGG